MSEQKIRIAAVKECRAGGRISRVASNFKVHPRTVRRWVKRYKSGGMMSLKTKRRCTPPWNKFSREIEEKIVYLKEKKPSLTIRAAQNFCRKKHIHISIKGIWKIWHRYNLIGRKKIEPYESCSPMAPATRMLYQKVKNLVNSKKTKQAAVLLNRLPVLAQDNMLELIPEKYLSLKHRLDADFLYWQHIPIADYCRRIHRLRRQLEKKNLFFSSIIAGMREILALQWMRAPKKELKILELLRRRVRGIYDPGLKFLLAFHQGVTYASLLWGDRAMKTILLCRRYAKNLPWPPYLFLGDLLTFLTDYGQAISTYKKGLAMEKDPLQHKFFLDRISYCLTAAGQYKAALAFKRRERKSDKTRSPSLALIQASTAMAQGDISRAQDFYQLALETSEKEQFRNIIHAASLGLAATHAALSRQSEARALLKKYLPLFKKHRMKHELQIRYMLLNFIKIPKRFRMFPMINLLYMLGLAERTKRTSDFRRAERFAVHKNLIGFLHRYLPFFPVPIRILMRKGKTINLPKPFLRLPVFNQETINYHVKFLGKIAVSRNDRTIPADLLPKDAAFLLHLIMKKEKQLMLDPVYHNLYPGSPAPARDFSHLLVRLKKQLLIPSHLLKIKKSYDHTFLFNSGLYFTSDYSDYLQALAQARALQQAGEWHYARREYLRAFRMFRGEPFHKMYDDWSLDTRHAILTRLETETIAFVENCLKHKNPNDAKMVLQRVRKIIPAYPGSLHEKNLEEFSTQPAREY